MSGIGRHRPGAVNGRASADTLRSLARQAATGALVGCGVLAGLLATDTAGLGSLIAHSADRLMLLSLMTGQFAVGFATFAAVTAIFLLPRGDVPAGR
jgi:hypothetical protein